MKFNEAHGTNNYLTQRTIHFKRFSIMLVTKCWQSSLYEILRDSCQTFYGNDFVKCGQLTFSMMSETFLSKFDDNLQRKGYLSWWIIICNTRSLSSEQRSHKIRCIDESNVEGFNPIFLISFCLSSTSLSIRKCFLTQRNSLRHIG